MDCLIGLGSNLGERERTLEQAIALLAQNPDVSFVAVSSFHVTQPVGGPAGQGEFLNAVARIETRFTPRGLLELLHGIEASLGRERQIHWGPRTIDLDLLLCADQIINEPDLAVPHPLMHQREFVLAPACEIAAEMRHPLLDKTLAELTVLLKG
jgi:2-amino-4-hydroxy-6-hydroxymethyldihydropteridine diphosphokinase